MKCQTECNVCAKHQEVVKETLVRNKKRNGGVFICQSCKILASPTRPQNTKEFWQKDELKQKLRTSMLTSEKFKKSRETGNFATGERNAAKRPEIRQKISAARRNSAALLHLYDGKPFAKKIRALIDNRHGWARKIRERDVVCTHCGTSRQLHAHHTVPFRKLLLKAYSETSLEGEDLIEFLVNHSTLKSAYGILLCSDCHIKEHRKMKCQKKTL